MRKILIVVALLFSQASYAQITNMNMNGVPARLSGYTDIDGSPYLFEDWSRADIATTNGGIKESVAYKFNIHDNELEVINEAGNKIFLNKSYIDYVLLERPSILIATSTEQGLLTKLLLKKGFDNISGIGPDDLVNVLAEGEKYSLVRKFYSDLVTPPTNSYSPSPGRMFVFEQSFYLIDADKNVESVRNKTKSIIKSLDEKDQGKARDIIKDGKLNLSREDHIVIFFQKLNAA